MWRLWRWVIIWNGIHLIEQSSQGLIVTNKCLFSVLWLTVHCYSRNACVRNVVELNVSTPPKCVRYIVIAKLNSNFYLKIAMLLSPYILTIRKRLKMCRGRNSPDLNIKVIQSIKNCLMAQSNWLSTRMHSTRMRTARSSSRWGPQFPPWVWAWICSP